jgi:hypothetical protein
VPAPAPPPAASPLPAAAVPPPPRRSEPHPKAAPPPATIAATGELTLTKIRSLWANVRTRAESEKASIGAQLARAIPADVRDDVITLRMPDAVNAEALKRSIDVLKRAVEAVVGRPLDVRVTVAAGAPPEPSPSAEAANDDPDDVQRYALERLL